MTRNQLGCVCGLALLVACSSDPTGADDRTTETFTLTTTRLTVQGATQYPAGTQAATFTVTRTGLVEVSATIGVQLDCEYLLYVEATNSSGNAILLTRARSQTLSLEGELEPGEYYALVGARDAGVSLCNGLPAEGVDFPHTIVVTHP